MLAWQNQALSFVGVFIRISAAMFLLPAFGERTVPGRARLALALALTIIISPMIFVSWPLEAVGRILTLFTEVCIGLFFGFMLRTFFWALQISGTIAANVTSLAQIFGGTSADPQPAIAHFLLISGLALAVMTGLHVKVVLVLVHSYDILPFGHVPDAVEFLSVGVSYVSNAFAFAFSLAAPFLLVSVVYNLALGAINRAMPQLMVAFVGAPAITGASLLLLVVAAPILLGVWLIAFEDMLANPGAF